MLGMGKHVNAHETRHPIGRREPFDITHLRDGIAADVDDSPGSGRQQATQELLGGPGARRVEDNDVKRRVGLGKVLPRIGAAMLAFSRD